MPGSKVVCAVVPYDVTDILTGQIRIFKARAGIFLDVVLFIAVLLGGLFYASKKGYMTNDQNLQFGSRNSGGIRCLREVSREL